MTHVSFYLLSKARTGSRLDDCFVPKAGLPCGPCTTPLCVSERERAQADWGTIRGLWFCIADRLGTSEPAGKVGGLFFLRKVQLSQQDSSQGMAEAGNNELHTQVYFTL